MLSLCTAMGQGMRGSAEATKTGAACGLGRPMGQWGSRAKQQTVARWSGGQVVGKTDGVRVLADGKGGTEKPWPPRAGK